MHFRCVFVAVKSVCNHLLLWNWPVGTSTIFHNLKLAGGLHFGGKTLQFVIC